MLPPGESVRTPTILARFPNSPSFDAPSRGIPSEFLDETYTANRRGMGLLYGENCTILSSTFFDWSTHVTDLRLHIARSACCRVLKIVLYMWDIRSWWMECVKQILQLETEWCTGMFASQLHHQYDEWSPWNVVSVEYLNVLVYSSSIFVFIMHCVIVMITVFICTCFFIVFLNCHGAIWLCGRKCEIKKTEIKLSVIV